MRLGDEPLDTYLEAYPKLRLALGNEWIREQNQIDPIESPFPLARWLRLDGFQPDLTTINTILQDLDGVPGIAERRRRIRSDAPALMETLTELYFGAWLRSRKRLFDWPPKGADFNVHLKEGQELAIEVTTPRTAEWMQDLFERLHLIALRTGYDVSVEHRSEVLPKLPLSRNIVANIVAKALKTLLNTGLGGLVKGAPSATQDYPEIGLTITWTLSTTTEPCIAATTSPTANSPYSMFYLLLSVAGRKTHQLPEDRAGALLIGTQNLPPLQLWSFQNAIQHFPNEDMQLDWTKLPNQVKYVIFYSLKLRDIEPYRAFWITNPASSFADPPGALHFLCELCPFPLCRNVESEVVLE